VLLQPAFLTALAEWPSMKAELKSALGEMRQMVREIYNLQEEVMDAIDPSGGSEADPGAVLPSLADAAFLAPQVLGQALVFLGGVFFFLLSRNELYVWFAKFLNSNSDTDDWSVNDFARADRTVTRYFSTVAAINTAFGIAVAIALSLIGLPGAIIWGMVAALTNFVVYLGAAVTAALLILAGTVSFDGWMAMLPAAAFIAINFLEGQFVTPSVVGRQMRINPLLVFVTLTFSVWLWGAIGGIVAIPLIVWMMALVADGGAHEAQPVTTEPVEA
jgi:predicted PurR-regulated permease PerM